MVKEVGRKVVISPDRKRGETLKKFLHCWKIYTTHKLSRQRAIHKAGYSYNIRLQQTVLNSLSIHCIAAKKARSYCIESNRIPKCENAFWIQAIEFYDHSTLRKFFKLWLDSYICRLPETDHWTNAKMHYNEKIVKKLFRSWIKYRKIKMERRSNLQKMQEFYVKKLLSKSFRGIRANVGREIGKRQKIENATNFHEKNVKQRFLNAWTSYCRRKRKLTIQINTRKEKMKNALLEKTMKQWHLYVRHKKCCKRKKNVSVNHYERKLVEKSLNLLKKYLLYKRTKDMSLVYLDTGIKEITLNVLNVCMDKWRVAVVRVSQERQKIQRAKDHWRLHQMKAYLRIWKEFSKNFKIKAQRNGVLKEIGKSILLERYMEVWMNKYRGFATTRLMEIEAASEYEKKIKLRLFRCWNKYVKEKLLGKVMIEEAQEMHRRLLLREGLKQILKNCLYSSELRYEDRLRRVRQNCVDDFDTMKKFFARWLAFAWAKSSAKDGEPTNENTLHLPLLDAASSRLVLPEYMMNKTRAQ